MLRIATYWNTIKYLKPIQLWSRIGNLFKTKNRIIYIEIPSARDLHISISELDEDETFCNRFHIEKMQKGELSLLNEFVNLNYSYSYTHSLKPLIHNNIYYFEYAIALASQYKKTGDRKYYDFFVKAYESYLNSDANVKSSYIIALHIPNMLIALDMFREVVDADFKNKVYCELYSQYRYLEQHQETHLLANHLFEDLKALTIAAYLFREDKKCKKYLNALHKQVKEQILRDGMHYELSPMYHKLILEDLLRIVQLSKNPDFPICVWINDTIQRMINVVASLEGCMGKTPLFNDSGDNVAKTCQALIRAVNSLCNIKPVYYTALSDSGYYKIMDTNVAMVIDAGKIGVDYQPAHGHCDCLSFELSYKGIPMLINQGTYEYQGDKRLYFRKTCAHNTVVVDENEQSQCWGGFRVGRRISNVTASLVEKDFTGSYVNFKGQKHERTISLKNSTLSVLDKTTGGAKVQSYLHFAPEFKIFGNSILFDNKEIAKIENVDSMMQIITDGELSWYAPEFGKLQKGSCLIFRWNSDNNQHGYKIEFN